MSEAAAVAYAEANVTDWSDWFHAAPYCFNFTGVSGGIYSAAFSECEWRIAHARTGTCYLRQKVMKVTETGASGLPTVEYDYVWIAANTADCQDRWNPDGSSKFVRTGVIGLMTKPALGPAPAFKEIRLSEGNEFSCLPGYFPDPGGLNGFPL